jgi:hypothetical protein
MPYDQIEELQSRRNEKVILFLTFEAVIAALAGGGLAYLVTGALPSILRLVVCLVVAGVGVGLTVEMGGLPLYQRILWWLRGALRELREGRTIHPDALSTRDPSPTTTHSYAEGGTVEIVQEP